jgi:hypothetical protein
VQVLTVEPPGMVYLGGIESRERGEWEGDVCPGRRPLALEEGESGQRQFRQLRVVFWRESRTVSRSRLAGRGALSVI